MPIVIGISITMKMLAHIVSLIPPNLIGVISTQPIASHSPNILSILIEYDDMYNILYLLRTPGDLNIINADCLITVLTKYELPMFRYEEIWRSIITNAHNMTSSNAIILHICYLRTGILDIISAIETRGIYHLIGVPLSTITVNNFIYSMENYHSTDELMFILNHMSEEQKFMIRETYGIDRFFFNNNLLAAVLPYYEIDDSDHIVAYALVHKSIYPLDNKSLSPAEYIVARKYSNWVGDLCLNDNYNLHIVISNLIDINDMPLVKQVLRALRDNGYNIASYEARVGKV